MASETTSIPNHSLSSTPTPDTPNSLIVVFSWTRQLKGNLGVVGRILRPIEGTERRIHENDNIKTSLVAWLKQILGQEWDSSAAYWSTTDESAQKDYNEGYGWNLNIPNGHEKVQYLFLTSREYFTLVLADTRPVTRSLTFPKPVDKMAPTYSRAQNRRQNRTGLVDHDIYEGLPIKQWRRDYVTVAPPPSQENINAQNDTWAVELPWGMPKDSQMLPQHSQDLLRAARSGKIYKRPAPLEEEEADPEIIPEKPEKKDDELKDKGFTAKAWKQIPRQDASDFEYLAKRRKGLVGVAASGSASVPTLIKATVKRTDAVGNEYVRDVVVPQGQHVEGEVLSQTVIPGSNPLSALPTPPRRKGPIKKKKMKGPGRGRKKILVAPTSAPAEGSGALSTTTASTGALGPADVKIEHDDNATSHQNDDTEMGGASNAASDHEDGEEGDDDDETEDEEGSDSHASPSKATRPSSPLPSSLPTMKPIPELIDLDTEMSGTTIPPSSSLTPRQALGEGFGSPLARESSALGTPPASSAPQGIPHSSAEDLQKLQDTMMEEVKQSAPTELPLAPPEPTIKEEIAAVQILEEEEEEEEMLLDILDNADIPEREPELPTLQKSQEASSMLSAEQDALAAESDLSEPPPELGSTIEDGEVEGTLRDEQHQNTEPLRDEDDDDDFPDLLGGLEASLA